MIATPWKLITDLRGQDALLRLRRLQSSEYFRYVYKNLRCSMNLANLQVIPSLRTVAWVVLVLDYRLKRMHRSDSDFRVARDREYTVTARVPSREKLVAEDAS